MSYGTRFALAAREAILLARAGGPKVALRMARSRLYRKSESLLFAKAAPFLPPELPAWVSIEAITPDAPKARRQDVLAAGAGADIVNFERGAVCYLAYVEGQPAGVGWRFRENRMLRHLGLEERGVYFGAAFVRPEFRGRGIAQMLFHARCHMSLRPDQVAYAETTEENVASQRHMIKAGCTLQGRVHLNTLAGFILRCTLTSA